jgi:hypothetical protein
MLRFTHHTEHHPDHIDAVVADERIVACTAVQCFVGPRVR